MSKTWAAVALAVSGDAVLILQKNMLWVTINYAVARIYWVDGLPALQTNRRRWYWRLPDPQTDSPCQDKALNAGSLQFFYHELFNWLVLLLSHAIMIGSRVCGTRAPFSCCIGGKWRCRINIAKNVQSALRRDHNILRKRLTSAAKAK